MYLIFFTSNCQDFIIKKKRFTSSVLRPIVLSRSTFEVTVKNYQHLNPSLSPTFFLKYVERIIELYFHISLFGFLLCFTRKERKKVTY